MLNSTKVLSKFIKADNTFKNASKRMRQGRMTDAQWKRQISNAVLRSMDSSLLRGARADVLHIDDAVSNSDVDVPTPTT